MLHEETIDPVVANERNFLQGWAVDARRPHRAPAVRGQQP